MQFARARFILHLFEFYFERVALHLLNLSLLTIHFRSESEYISLFLVNVVVRIHALAEKSNKLSIVSFPMHKFVNDFFFLPCNNFTFSFLLYSIFLFLLVYCCESTIQTYCERSSCLIWPIICEDRITCAEIIDESIKSIVEKFFFYIRLFRPFFFFLLSFSLV